MLCERCHEREAIVHITRCKGEMTKHDFCATCATHPDGGAMSPRELRGGWTSSDGERSRRSEIGDEDESDPDIAPSVRRHISMQSVFEIGCSVAAPGVWVFYKFSAGHGIGISVMEGAIFFSLFGLGYLIPHTVFRHLVGAACPSPDCHGKAFPKGRDPVIYVCASCRHSFPTGLSEGGDSF